MKVFPVTTSTLSAQELGRFIKDKYNLDSSFDCKLFRTGMNHTYMLSSIETKYVLRVYCYNWRPKKEIIEEINLLNKLHENNLSVSFPLKDKNQAYIQEVQAPEGLRYAVLFSFAKGDKIRFLSNETCFAIGELMAKFHKTTENQTIERTVYNKKAF